MTTPLGMASKLAPWILIVAFTGIVAGQEVMKLNATCSPRAMFDAFINTNDNSRQKNIMNICGPDFSVYVDGLTNDGREWTAEASLTPMDPATGNEDTTNAVTGSSPVKTVTAGEVITDVRAWFDAIPPLQIYFQQPACENIVVVARLRLIGRLSGRDDKVYETATTARVWCDFSDIDLHLVLPASADQVTFIDAVVGSPVPWPLPGTDTITAAVTGTLKPLANDGCYFAVAFLSPLGVTIQDVPLIHSKSTILGVQCFSPDDINTVDFKTMLESSPIPEDVCGEYNLTLMLDALNVAHNEMHLDNNFISIPIRVPCAEFNGTMNKPPRCEVVNNGWGAKDSRMFYRSQHETTMFAEETENGDHWLEKHDHELEDIERFGYGVLKVLSAYLNQTKVPECVNDNQDVNSLSTLLSDLEGGNGGATPLDTGAIGSLLEVFLSAKTTITSGTLTEQTITQAMNNKQQVMEDSTMPFMEQISKAIEKASYNATITTALIATNMDTDGNVKRNVTSHLGCDLPMKMEMFLYLEDVLKDYSRFSNSDDMEAEYIKTEIKELVGNLTRGTLAVRYMYPDFDCLENNFLRLLMYLKKRVPTDQGGEGLSEDQVEKPKWMFNEEQMRNTRIHSEGDDSAWRNAKNCYDGRGTRLNNCFRKLKALCSKCRGDEQDLTAKDVCPMIVMKKYAMDHATVIGLRHLDKMSLPKPFDEDRKWCEGEPLISKREPLQFWKKAPLHPDDPTSHSVLLKGRLSPDNRKICWRKRALCSCETCETPMMRRRRGARQAAQRK
ncbi:uncharacterized protein LOC128213397 [Mya arenaria]|uniref:uncharacterized protein LOC128213397 n=1 Tax=Mya arenaria TaxID=6604 RepID=UPI0022E2AA0A|nr:uncharacterized protein LOC128213397 [Mya arenaria]